MRLTDEVSDLCQNSGGETGRDPGVAGETGENCDGEHDRQGSPHQFAAGPMTQHDPLKYARALSVAVNIPPEVNQLAPPDTGVETAIPPQPKPTDITPVAAPMQFQFRERT